MLHSWDLSVREAIALQDELRSRVIPRPPDGFAPRLVAGADISIEKFSTRGFAGIVVVDAASMETIDQSTAVVEIGFPYVPGLLSFRELAAVQRAWDALETKPDVIMATGFRQSETTRRAHRLVNALRRETVGSRAAHP